jgi:ectoine hydroxylase-related dioxygenase (phytanoyl-CoA dioxygenase family)
MTYPDATPADIESYRTHGYLVVRDAVDTADIAELVARCDEIIEHRHEMAQDWAWEKGKSKQERDFTILQSSPSLFWTHFRKAPFRRWAVSFGSALMGRDVEFWYDQFLAKPPHLGAPTRWHQDEAYWGRNLDDRGVTCWMPFHDVDDTNGCMHFIDGGHRDGVLPHRQPANIQSDLLFCEPDEARDVSCPIRVGSVTFHHSKTPHMTGANHTDEWRRILTQHLRVVGSGGEGDHYPWKVTVNQFSDERTTPRTR